MTDSFSRWCGSALTHTVALRDKVVRRRAFNGKAVTSGLVAATLLLIMAGCNGTSHGITRVGTSGQEVIAESLSISVPTHGGRPEEYGYFASQDDGRSWEESAAPTEVLWSEGSVDTPVGAYWIEGPNIVLTKPGGQPEIVYSVAHWNTSSNRWYQAERTRHLKDRVLATEPTAIVYDSNSGNIIAGLGIQGAAVGAPDGQWTPVAVGEYSPVSYSRELKVKELLRQHSFWITVFVFPATMVALTFFIRDIRCKPAPRVRAEENQRIVGIWVFVPLMALVGAFISYFGWFIWVMAGLWGTLAALVIPIAAAIALFRMASQSTAQDRGCLIMVFTLPSVLVVAFISASFLMLLGRPDFDTPTSGGLDLPFAVISATLALSCITISWRRQWRIRWWIVIAAYAAMSAFVAFFFLGWVQSDVPLIGTQLASFILCLATAVVIYRTFRVDPFHLSQEEADTHPD